MGVIIDRNTGRSYNGDVFSLIILKGVLGSIMEKRVLKPTFYTEVKCDWCDKSISPRAACCPYCGHPGPGLEWKNNPKKISLKFTPPVLGNMCCFHVGLNAEWSISNGSVLHAVYHTEFYQSNSLKDYLLEIEALPNAHVSVHLRMEDDDPRDDFGGTFFYPPMNEQGAIITEPGMYEIVLCKIAKKGWFITKYIDAFKINRIG